MYMLIAIVVTAVVIFLAWRGIGAHPSGATETSGPQARHPSRPTRPTRTIAPDDDPEFLGEIDRKLRGEDKSS
ncbi:hypothetical protein JL107_04810 [Nakamurella flavida]|uniref:Uncharacterized protein n=1 Tax=Nakamurella flavida TaxID=363630 RepID=A0A938YDN5_9ACTN|nr:hypothetical protein [Nakamurella flavida]MBM9475761.1 hypothetical protein [Nakamurella flavida]MDP9777959.1 hypothetical protein [Nakamurella flavida]